MVDYASLKVPELKKLLQEKSLSVQGNKADLIARLKENDAKVTNTTAAPAADGDEIDYSDDDVKVRTSKPAVASSIATGAAASASASAIAAETAPVESDAPAVDQATAATEDAVPEAAKESFALNLSATDAEMEARKRADRAKRFGIPAETDEEAKKRTDRAARFGVDAGSVQVAGLDDALPERRSKRGRAQDKDDDAEAGARPSKRQSTDRTRERRQPGRGGRSQQNSGSSRSGGRQDRGNSSNNHGGKKTRSVLDDRSERVKAEQRRKRFAASD